jgi:dephospho-CoA kinase
VLRVGLTGGIGSGKSEVSRRLADHGAVLIDADVAAREVVVPGSPGLARIASAFGEGVLRPDGSLNRERLGEIVFGDPGLRAKLNEIVHPLVPLLAESRGKGGFDVVIVVDVPPELQVERLVRLRGMAPDRARARMAAQASREQRLAVADVVIDNSGSPDDLDRRVAEVWVNLERRAGLGNRSASRLPRTTPPRCVPLGLGCHEPGHREQGPWLARVVQLVAAALGKGDVRSGHELLDGP